MAIIRVEKNKNYTTMSNYHLRDKNLSLKAKGLMSLMLSLPDDWDYSVVGLEKICVETNGTINGIIQELEKNNYVQRKRIYENGKIKEWEYVIYEEPHLDVKNQHIEKQYVENLDVENQAQLNTNITNKLKEKETNKLYIKEIIDYLNEKTSSKYSYNGKEQVKHINARLSEGYKVDDFKKVIDIKCKKWQGTEMEQYLRPSTLFGTKFENYLNEKNVIYQKPVEQKDNFIKHEFEKKDFDDLFDSLDDIKVV